MKYINLERTYDNVKRIHDSKHFFELNFNLIILRPIREFIETKFLSNMIQDEIENLIYYIVINLVFNVGIEFVFLFIVWKFIMKKIREFEQYLENFIEYVQ